MNPELTEALEPTRRVLEQAIALAPRALMLLLVLLVGLLLSSVAGRAARWLVRKSGLEALLEKAGVSRVLYAAGYTKSSADLLGGLVWAGGLLITLASAAETVGLPGVAEGIAAVIGFLPRLVVAGFLLVGGVLGADLLRRLLLGVTARRDDLDSPRFVAEVVYYTVLVVSGTLAAEHLGLETGLVNALIQITAAAGLFSAGLAFALGSRAVFQNLLGRLYAQKMFHPGDRLTVGGRTGVLVRFGTLSAYLQLEGGALEVIPCGELIGGRVTIERVPEAEPRPDPTHD